MRSYAECVFTLAIESRSWLRRLKAKRVVSGWLYLTEYIVYVLHREFRFQALNTTMIHESEIFCRNNCMHNVVLRHPSPWVSDTLLLNGWFDKSNEIRFHVMMVRRQKLNCRTATGIALCLYLTRAQYIVYKYLFFILVFIICFVRIFVFVLFMQRNLSIVVHFTFGSLILPTCRRQLNSASIFGSSRIRLNYWFCILCRIE